MRATVRSVLMVVAIAAITVCGPAGVSTAGAVFSGTSALRVASVLPTAGEVVGVAHPVIVTFSAPVADRRSAERFIDIKTTPAMTGRLEWSDSQTAQWIPDRFWPAHSDVKVSVSGLSAGFKTGPAVVGVADIAQHTFTVSIDGVETGAPPRLPAPHHRPHRGEEGVLPASMGKAEFPTPVGSYSVISKNRTVIMDSSSVGIPIDDPEGYRFLVDHGVRFTGRGLYVHSAPWAVDSLGLENVSHGCISLSPTDAEWYFDTVKAGDPIIVQ